MNKTIGTLFSGLLAFAGAGALHAHHSGSMYQTVPVWIRGTVVSFQPINPHTILTLEAMSENGPVSWAVEGPGESQLDRMEPGVDVPDVGDVIEVCAFPYKSAAELSRMFPGVDFSARQHGFEDQPGLVRAAAIYTGSFGGIDVGVC